MHEPSGLEPDSSRAWLESFEPRGATSRAGSSPGLDSARADSSPLAVSWRFLGGSSLEPAREQHYGRRINRKKTGG